MVRSGLCIGIVGATGAVGTGVLEALAASSIRVAQIVAVASDRSIGLDVEFEDECYPVAGELPPLKGVDCLFLCAPADVSREAARAALRAGVPAIDLSGAMAGEADVPLRVADLHAGDADAPLVATPSGAALALCLALAPLADRAGLVRVSGTLLGSAALAGLRGSDSLLNESLALFNQQDPPDPSIFGRPVAFDCGPGADDDAGREDAAIRDLVRLFGPDLAVHLTAVQVPTFLGLGATLEIETAAPLSAAEAGAALGKARGVDVWSEEVAGPTLRAASGRDTVLVGRVREDSTRGNSLALWLACDPVCLAAANAVKLAEARLRGR
jgi:aspartate-semialdehyde dehydrogenase